MEQLRIADRVSRYPSFCWIRSSISNQRSIEGNGRSRNPTDQWPGKTQLAPGAIGSFILELASLLRPFRFAVVMQVLSFAAFPAVACAQAESAKQLTQQGHSYLNRGMPAEAFQTWKKAKELYEKQKNQNGVIGSLVNQSQAQQMLGQPFNACWSLIIALELDAELCRNQLREQSQQSLLTDLKKIPTNQITVAALQNLGIVSRELWKQDQAITIFEYAIIQSQSLDDVSVAKKLQLSLANTYQAQWRAIKDRHALTQEPKTKSSLLRKSLVQGKKAFQRLEALFDDSDKLAINAKINWLQFYQQVNEWAVHEKGQPELIELQQQVQPLANSIISELENVTFDPNEFSSIEGVYGRLKIAENLLKLYQHRNFRENAAYPLTKAYQLTKASLQQSEELNNKRAKAHSLTLLGQLYAEGGQDQKAYQALNQAKNIGISGFSADTVYPAAWELAKLNKRRGDRQAALKSYENAIAALEEVRGNLLSVNQELGFSFRDEVEPVYREYLQLLTSAPQPDFEKIIETTETLQVISLENFLQCGKLAFAPLKEQPNLPTAFYLIDLGNRLEVLVRANGQLNRYSVNADTVKQSALRLQQALQNTNLKETPPETFLPHAQALYEAVIRPGEHLIGADQRIIFIDSGTLNNLPIGLFHDGEKYLVEKYKVANSLGTYVLSSKQSHKKPKATIAGISGIGPAAAALNLPPLPEVEQEEEVITSILGNSRTTSIMDESFTIDKLSDKLPNSSILHIATHGKFASDPSETYLLAWKERIDLAQLEQIIRQRSTSKSAGLDLIFLSACESAKGDGRSQLGLAGLATQAGAKNAIASLWLVESESTSLLAQEFYRKLSTGVSYAEALQQAQLKLKNTPKFKHPYHWAPFILLGGL